MRTAVMELLTTDSELNGLGIDLDHVWPNFALDRQIPRDATPWLVLRWGAASVRFGGPGNRSLNVWAYIGRQYTTDHSELDRILNRVLNLLCGTTNYTAADGGKIAQVTFRGFSEDLADEGYDAIARSAQFQVNGSDS